MEKFHIAICLVIVVVLLVLSRIKIRKIKREKQELADELENNKTKFKEKDNQIKDKEKEIKEKEIQSLRAHVNPHLFNNTLDFINASANKTVKSIEALSKILDYVIYKSQSPYVSLINEVEFLDQYIKLQQIRYENGFNIKIDLDSLQDKGLLRKKRIAPLLFIDYIENAFKYTDLSHVNSFISIKVEIINERELIFSVKNTSNRKRTENESGGFGIDNLKKRLDLLYPEKHWSDFSDDSGVYTANLKIIIDE